MAYNPKIEYLSGGQNIIADMLSRLPDTDKPLDNPTNSDNEEVVDISDNTFEINTFNSNEFCPSTYVQYQQQDENIFCPDDCKILDLDMAHEQAKDLAILQIIDNINQGKDDHKTQKLIIIEDILYFISKPDTKANLRLYVPEHLRQLVIKQYHDNNGHPGVDRTYGAIALKYYWPKLYNQMQTYVSACVTCQKNASTKIKIPSQETDTPPFPFAKLQLDLSGPHPETLSGNKYIVSFICTLTGWVEAFPVKTKEAENIVHLLLNEIFPRHSAPLELVTGNGKENVNRIMKDVTKELRIHHVRTSFYNPTANSRVERSHRTLNSTLAKLMDDHVDTCHMHLLQQDSISMSHLNTVHSFNYMDEILSSPLTISCGPAENMQERSFIK